MGPMLHGGTPHVEPQGATSLGIMAPDLRQSVCFQRGWGTRRLGHSIRQKSCYDGRNGQFHGLGNSTGGAGEGAATPPKGRVDCIEGSGSTQRWSCWGTTATRSCMRGRPRIPSPPGAGQPRTTRAKTCAAKPRAMDATRCGWGASPRLTRMGHAACSMGQAFGSTRGFE